MSSEISLYYATFPDPVTAEKICRLLLDEKLIACANIQAPMTSIYPWQGKVETAQEVAVWLKSKTDLAEKFEARYLELHPYETPCLMQFPVGHVNAGYRQWLLGSF